MKTKLTQSVLMLFLVFGFFVMGAGRVEGKSVNWNTSALASLITCGGVCAESSNVSVTYSVDMYNTVSGLLLNDDIVIPVGTQLNFIPKPFIDTDISWFYTGFVTDSPYGYWGAGGELSAIPKVYAPLYWFGYYFGWSDWTYGYGVHTDDNGSISDMMGPLEMQVVANPPILTITASPTLSCGAYNGTSFLCTVIGAGAVSASINFSNTYAKVYNYDNLSASMDPSYAVNSIGNFAIPAQTITFNLTAVSSNNPPTTPTLSVDAPSKNINTDFIFTTSPSTDPDGDTLRYGFDFTGSAVTPGLYVPSTATLASGTAQSAPYQWPTPGTYFVRVRAEDNRGGVSGWSIPVSVTVNALPPNPVINTFTINGSTGSVNLTRGDMRNIAWTVSNAVSCSASSGDVWSGNKAVPTGTDLNLPANVTTPHTLDCVNVIGVHTSSTIQVNVSCTPSTGTFGTCACATETKTRTNTSALCIAVVESTSCDVDEKKACRNFNWTEGTP